MFTTQVEAYSAFDTNRGFTRVVEAAPAQPTVMLLGQDAQYEPFMPKAHNEQTPGSVGQVATCLWALKHLMDNNQPLGGEVERTYNYLQNSLRTDLPVKGMNLFPAPAAAERAVALTALANMYTDPEVQYDWRYNAADVATSLRALPLF